MCNVTACSSTGVTHGSVCHTSGHRSKPRGDTGLVTQNTSHTDLRDTATLEGAHRHNPSPSHVVCHAGTWTRQPQGNETLTHRHVWQHTNTAHADTPRDTKPHTQTHPVTKTQPVLVPRPLHGTHVIPTLGETRRESDGDTPGHTQTPRTCPLGENAAAGHS